MRVYNAESPKQDSRRFNSIVKTKYIDDLGIVYLWKGVSLDFLPLQYLNSWFNPAWAPDIQAKFSNSLLISQRYSNFQEAQTNEFLENSKNILACLLDGFESWKNRGRKSRDPLPLGNSLMLFATKTIIFRTNIFLLQKMAGLFGNLTRDLSLPKRESYP